MKKNLKALVLGTIAAGLLWGAPPAEAAVQVNPIPDLPADFIKGADLSMVPELEKIGIKFKDVDGTPADAITIAHNHGVNWVRVRIWNDPKARQPMSGGKTDEARALEVAKRAKALGMKVLVDFHYSDGWADPGQQHVPKAWANDTKEQLVQHVYDYTLQVVKDFQAQGVTPDMIQVGNEVKYGMMWPIGKLDAGSDGKDFADLMAAGLKACRDADPAIKLMIHLPDGGSNELFRNFFDQLITQNGVNDFDVIGFSYYPFWHGPLDVFQKNINDVAARYNKDVVVAETALGFTLDNYDSENNHYGGAEEKASGFCATVQGQATGLREIMNAVNNVPNHRGIGMFYWAPDWVAGLGWQEGAGNNWENLAMFDKNNKALESWDVYKDVSDQSLPTVAKEVVDIDEMEVRTSAGIPVKLPETVRVTFSDDSMEILPITWSKASPMTFDANGEYTVAGKIGKTGTPVDCYVTVEDKANLLKNGDFETMSLDGWKCEGTGWIRTHSNPENIKGKCSMDYWAEPAFNFRVSQEVTGLSDGLYTLEVETQGNGKHKSYDLFVITADGEKQTAEIKDTGWKNWSTTKIENIEVKGGKVTVGLEQDAFPGNWGTIDNIKFYRQK